MEKLYTVYIHTSPSNKAYVGITSMIPEKRWKSGLGYLSKGKNKEYLQPAMANAVLKYSNWNEWEHFIFAEGLPKEKAEHIEQLLIALFKTQDCKYGYNIQNGGSVDCVSEETKKKMSNSHKGKKQSEESIRKSAEARTGRIVSEETREKMRQSMLGKFDGENNPMFGKHHSEEAKKKMSEAKQGYVTWIKGKHHSEETKKKFSEQRKGRYVGKNHPSARQIVQCDLDGKFIRIWEYAKQASDELNILLTCIIACCRGRQKTSGGFKWMYLDDYQQL